MNKKILLSFVIVLLLYGFIFPQWSTNPNNNLIVGYGLDPQICSDSAGGCYITYDYESTGYPRKLALERIDRYGYKPWGTKKQILGELPEQWQAEIIEDGEGGVIVSYQDNQIVADNYITRVRVQKVDSSGNFLWSPTGVRVTLAEVMHGAQKVVTDGNGGCVLLWQDSLANYRINRIDRNGQRVWGDSGILIGNAQSSMIIRASDGNYYVQVYPDIFRINQDGEILNQYSTTLALSVPDPEGGIILSGRVGSINNRRLVAQRKDSLGNNLWQEPYVEIADSLHINTMLSIVPKNGYYFYGWMGKKNSNNEILQIQGIRNNGTILFNQGSIPLSSNPGLTTYIPIIPSDSGSCIFISSYTNGTFGQKIDTLGYSKWNPDQVLLNYPHLGLDRSFVISDCIGGAIGIGVYLTDFGIPVFKASSKGILGEIIPVELISFTGVLDKDKVILNWVTATETNNSGFEIQRKDSGARSQESEWEVIGYVDGNGTTTQTNTYLFIDKNITNGIYKYRLKQIDFDGTYKYSNEIEIVINNTPTEFALYQNYPNPFNPATVIIYQIPKDGLVTLKVYDILGKEVATLLNENKSVGRYSINFDGSNLASGVYIYQIRSGEFVSSKKMMLIK